MEYSFNNSRVELYLYSCDSIIKEVNQEFADFTGFTKDKLLGKSLIEIGELLRINSQIFLDNIQSKYSGFIFTNLLEAIEVNISLSYDKETNKKKYTFTEKPNSSLNDKLIFVDQIFSESKSGVAVYSVPDSILLKANQKYLDFFDSPFNKEENSIGRPYREIVTGFIGSQVEVIWNTVLKTQKASRIKEFRFDEFARGTTYWNTSKIPIFEKGYMKYIFHDATEITESILKNQRIEEQNKIIQEQKEQLEEENTELISIIENLTETINKSKKIEEQKKELEAIIENISDGISIFDNEGKYILFNKSAREMFCTSYEYTDNINEWCKQSKLYDIHGQKIDNENNPSLKVMKGEKFEDMRMEIKFPHKSLQIDVSGTPIYDSKGEFSLGVLSTRDMTEYLKNEEVVLSKYEFLNKIIDSFNLPVIRMSCPDLKIVDINKKAISITKLVNPNIKSINGIKGKRIEDLFDIFTTRQYYNSINEVSKDKKTKYLNKQNQLINGNETYWNIIFEPMIKMNGEIQEILILLIDVTEEIKANVVMEKALEEQEEFFANISHELKTPLNVIFATSQLLDMYFNSGTLEEKQDSFIKYIHSIKQNSYRLSKLINNIVDLSKIKAGFFELNLSNNNIVEVVEEIVMSVTNFTEIKGLNIIFDTDTEEKIIACDPEKIERILLNLISNAIKFSNKGDEILVDIKNNEEFVQISVKDNGIGIEDNNLEMIFDRFKQVDKSLSRNAEGTGIGLSLVKSIVELHDGDIYIESQFGVGSTFTVVLPTKTVMQENMLLSSTIRNTNERIKVELSDI